MARSPLSREHRLDAHHVLDGVAGDGDDDEAGERLRHPERAHGRLQRFDEPVGHEGGAAPAAAQAPPGPAAAASSAGATSRCRPRLLLVPWPMRERHAGGEDDQQHDRHDHRQLGRVALVGPAGRRGDRSGWPLPRPPASAASTSSSSGRLPNLCDPWRRPPARKASPSTSSVLARIEPMSAERTTSTRPACRAKTPMKNSGRLPRADCRTPVAPARADGPADPCLADHRRQTGQADRRGGEDGHSAGAADDQQQCRQAGGDRDQGDDPVRVSR